jgi:endonuclease/exonuclease/phosphatase (EEP) superfamily protein YafD
MLSLVVLRIVWHDGWRPLTCLNAFSAYVYLPAYFVLLFSLWARRAWLAAAAAAIVVCHLAWVGPDFAPASDSTFASPAASPVVRIFFSNVSHFNADYSGIVAEIERLEPDVVAFAEFNSRLQRQLQRAPYFEQYRFGTDLQANQVAEVAVFSRLAARQPTVRWFAERPTVVIEVPLGASALRIFALHSPRPMKWPAHRYDAYWQGILPLFAAEARPLVVIGDFNATQHSWVYQQLLASGLRSAHVDRGRGFATTWPNGRLPLPPIRIDHALLSPEVACVRIEEGIGQGTDHEPLVLDVRLR